MKPSVQILRERLEASGELVNEETLESMRMINEALSLVASRDCFVVRVGSVVRIWVGDQTVWVRVYEIHGDIIRGHREDQRESVTFLRSEILDLYAQTNAQNDNFTEPDSGALPPRASIFLRSDGQQEPVVLVPAPPARHRRLHQVQVQTLSPPRPRRQRSH